jgi:phage terminase Nu1 subunit (DNA packaging protein)
MFGVKPLVYLFLLILCGVLIYLSSVVIKEGYTPRAGNPNDPNERDDSDDDKVKKKVSVGASAVAMATDTSEDQKEMVNAVKMSYTIAESITRMLITVPYNISKDLSSIPVSVGKFFAQTLKTNIRMAKDLVTSIFNTFNGFFTSVNSFFQRIVRKLNSLLNV